MTRSRCKDFLVFPIEACYAVHWSAWRDFFNEDALNQTMLLTRNSIVVHVWNKYSINEPVRVGSKVAYGQLAAQYCPLVYASCGEYF